MITINKQRSYYKPFEYPWAFDLWKHHEAMHWTGSEVSFHTDVRDWNEILTQDEKSLLTHLFRFFTQADIDVSIGYASHFLPYFSGIPELEMMMSSFAAREAVHIDAYSLLIETVKMPEETYKQFSLYKEMQSKHEYLKSFDTDSVESVLKTLAVYSAFTEGMQLFSSFVVLLNFPRQNKMKNMGNIIAWSIRDESLHVEGMTKVFKEFYKQYLENFPTRDTQEFELAFKEDIKLIANQMVNFEDDFIDLIFSSTNSIQGLTKEDVKSYIRYITNIRWKQLGFDGTLYPERIINPLPWVEGMINGQEHTNFFEGKSTSYSKGMTRGTMEDIKW